MTPADIEATHGSSYLAGASARNAKSQLGGSAKVHPEVSTAPHPEPRLIVCYRNSITASSDSAAARLDSYRSNQVRPPAGTECLRWSHIARNAGNPALARTVLI